MSQLKCEQCGVAAAGKPTAKGGSRTPNGWKRQGEHHYCKTCWQSRYEMRAIVFPVVGPVGDSWDDLGHALKQCWSLTTNLANWAVTELAKADCVRRPEDERLPRMPAFYLYPQARAAFPDLPSKATAALLHTVQQRYLKARLAVIWRSEASLPRYRYPVAFPTNNQGWRAQWSEGEGKAPLVTVRILDKQFQLRLRNGPHFRRQLADFAQLVEGKGVPGELRLYRQRASEGDHRGGVPVRTPGGGNRAPYRVMAMITGWFPKAAARQDRRGTLQLLARPNVFLEAVSAGRAPWVVNADHVRRWISQQRTRLRRLGQDTKGDVRAQSRRMVQIADYRGRLTQKHQQRLQSFCHEAAASLARHAERSNVAAVHLEPGQRWLDGEFPWAYFAKLLAGKLATRGIAFINARENVDASNRAA